MLNILIVDDHALVRSTIRTQFKNYSGFAVCGEAVDGADAIEKATKLKPDFILLDWAMPGINGGVTALVLKELMPNLRIIVFTVHAEELRTSLPSKFGIDAVVAKSDGIGKVVECVRTLLPVKPMERRRTERLKLRIGLRVSVLNSTAPMQTTESLNLSSAGIYFVTDWPLVRSTPVQLLFKMPPEVTHMPATNWVCTGHVVHIEPVSYPKGSMGVGAQFDCYEVIN